MHLFVRTNNEFSATGVFGQMRSYFFSKDISSQYRSSRRRRLASRTHCCLSCAGAAAAATAAVDYVTILVIIGMTIDFSINNTYSIFHFHPIGGTLEDNKHQFIQNSGETLVWLRN